MLLSIVQLEDAEEGSQKCQTATYSSPGVKLVQSFMFKLVQNYVKQLNFDTVIINSKLTYYPVYVPQCTKKVV